MKNLKKNQLKLDKEVVASLSGAELSKVLGGGTMAFCETIVADCVPQSVNICQPVSKIRPCFQSDGCSKLDCISDGTLSKCFCEAKTLNC